jgi:hypothetical protein
MRYILFFLTFILISSCESIEKKMFFDFDEANYYSLNKKNEEEFFSKAHTDSKDSIFENIFLGDFPKNLDDNSFQKEINSNRFTKYKVSKNDIDKLKNDIFKKRLLTNPFVYAYACAPEYRDILVFMKNNKISGIAKICLSCNQYYFLSNKKNIETNNFGQNEEYNDLKKIFESYKSK